MIGFPLSDNWFPAINYLQGGTLWAWESHIICLKPLKLFFFAGPGPIKFQKNP
jgi:hypothetical protein